jgi:DNA mismatch repair protein MutS2
MDAFSRDTLEFGAVIAILRPYLSGPISYPLLDSLGPRTDLEAIRAELTLAGEAREYLRQRSRPQLGALPDPRPILEKLAVEGVSCAALEILALLDVARAAGDLRSLFLNTGFTRLDELAARLPDLRDLMRELDGKIRPDGSVDSSASPELARIRRSIERLRSEIQSTLNRLVGELARQGRLQDAVVTLRNERLVIPVRAEEKRRVAGVIHGASASGATVYIEPLETVPLNNEVVELEEREFAEIERILGEFTGKLRARRDSLLSATALLSQMDLAFAKAEFARDYDGCLPEFTSENTLALDGARHPLLEKTLRADGREPVPLTIELAPPKRVMVISGPNAGGKTIALKTLGLAALMAQSGLPVAARAARLPLFHHVLADIGDLQSIEASLSTFSARVTHIQAMAEVAGPRDLVLLDEIGASTDPQEGAALAVAILEYFRERGAMVVATTHHARLKAYAAETPAAMNAAMEFDERSLQPTYRILAGLPGKSCGLDMAARLGLAPAIVNHARARLDRAEAEASALLANLHEQQAALERQMAAIARERDELETRRRSLERDFETERRRRLQELDQRLEQTVRELERKWEQIVAELRAEMARPGATERANQRLSRRAALLARQARAEWNAQVLEALGATPSDAAGEATERPPAVGDTVRVPNLPAPARLISLSGDDHAEVEIGRLRMRVRKRDLRVIKSAEGARAGQATSPGPPPPRPETWISSASGAEINVIGASAEEALDRVDKFLDDAFLARRLRLRVVHGHGRGILRGALHKMFASHPHVEKFYPAPANEGGTGATIVELKP